MPLWLSVYEYLTERKFEFRAINPIRSEAFCKMYIRQINEVITTIPGIGDILGAITLSEIGGIQRFGAPRNTGLDVKVSQSGEFTGTKQKISKLFYQKAD